MPIASFCEGLQKTLSFLPGTYGTALLKNHMMRGAFAEMERLGFPDEVLTGIRDGIDCNLYFFGNAVPTSVMMTILVGSVVFFTGVFVVFHLFKKNAK